ncbi:transcriptional regulator [Agromyces bauzanensis]|uniref:MarR family transcriptional regulator n=1 Tax=Agromyces bauzanensis TaxID=1308924 RepID=A0A917P9Z3_9MICO|nr:transcriptional regulator [Agromyces bauzanensis]GGJ68148.1 MarR family transcriptional regulator [Agromyces bauzanensis]
MADRPDAPHPRHRLDPLLQRPVPFSIAALLAAADEAEFAFVRDAVELSDSALSKQAAALEAAGYVTVRKGYLGRVPRTWLSMTSKGRAAFAVHLDVLREIAG